MLMILNNTKVGILMAVFTDYIDNGYEIIDYNHAIAILKYDFQEQFQDITEVLDSFILKRTDIVQPGGRKSPIAHSLDSHFERLGWAEKQFQTQMLIDGVPHDTPTHKIDCVKGRVALEIEWNNKDPFYDRDLTNFRILHERDAISVGVIVTRTTELQSIFNDLGKGSSYGNSTTHLGKLKPRIDGQASGGCPLLVFAIKPSIYREDL